MTEVNKNKKIEYDKPESRERRGTRETIPTVSYRGILLMSPVWCHEDEMKNISSLIQLVKEEVTRERILEVHKKVGETILKHSVKITKIKKENKHNHKEP